MHDASGGGIGKAAEQLLQEMQKAQQELQKKPAGQMPGQPNAAFQQALNNTQNVQGVNNVQAASATQQTAATKNVLLQAKIMATSPTTRVGEAAKAQRSRLAKMLDQMIGGQDKMNRIMKLALSGHQFNSQELLAMQAGVYRYSQELDLTGKVVEKATSGIKQTLNTQV
ncbi:MAG: ATP-dependent helicase HrpB [Deltaproteobacteria bacterium]|nr:ATP-dependent helicase HrpB [Deltaproteobacteria bacterium]